MAETYLLDGEFIGDLDDDNPFASHEHYTTLTVTCTQEATALVEMKFEEDALSVSYFEKEKGAHWQVEVILPGQHESVDLSGIEGIHGYQLEPLEMQDWVTENQKDFPPLEIGQFYIHGSHLPPKAGAISLEIDAGRAFGTGEHATTAGCLLAMQNLNQEGTKKRGQETAPALSPQSGAPSEQQNVAHGAQLNIKNIADIGCGTGILAMAAKYLWPEAFVIGGDMDEPSVITAIENAEKNGMKGLPFVTAAGMQHDEIQAGAPYDLIIANILAGPLVTLAPEICAGLAETGYLILSGLLIRQEEEVLEAYAAQGLTCTNRLHRDEWSALTLTRG